MPHRIPIPALLCLGVLLVAACDDDPATPPGDEVSEPLIAGTWTLRFDTDASIDPPLLAVAFSGDADSLTYTAGTTSGTIAPVARHLDLDLHWIEDGCFYVAETSLDVAADHASLTGTFTGTFMIPDKSPGGIFDGTIFGVPGDVVPPLTVDVTPHSLHVPLGASVQMRALVDGWSGNSVDWSLDPATAGSIDTRGIYTAPETTEEDLEVSVIAVSRIDQGARDTASLFIEAPAVTCLDLRGNWNVELQDEGEWEDHVWFIAQLDCAGELADRGHVIDLELEGGHASGRIDFTHTAWEYWIYDLYFEEGELLDGSIIRVYDPDRPETPELHPVRGYLCN